MKRVIKMLWCEVHENMVKLDEYLDNKTPITIIDSEYDDMETDVTIKSMTGDGLWAVLDADYPDRGEQGLKKGQTVWIELEEIGGVRVRES